jgi:hypothetical protein
MMPVFPRDRRFDVIVIALLCMIATLGCQRGPKMYHVSGKVLYKDGSVPRGGVAVVSFMPTKESTAEVRQAASGAIGPDGSFSMFSRVAGDGVYAGDYAVTFTVLKAPMDPRPLILEKYRSIALTPYKVTVDRDIDDLSYEIEPLPGVTGGTAAGNVRPSTNATPSSG